MDKITRNEHIKNIFLEHFDIVGFTSAKLPQSYTKQLKSWIGKKFHASMEYMERTLERRLDTHRVLPNASSVIVVALNYFPGNHSEIGEDTSNGHYELPNRSELSRPSKFSSEPKAPDQARSDDLKIIRSDNSEATSSDDMIATPNNSSQKFKVARYAWGDDYHKVFEEKFSQCLEACKEFAPTAQFKPYVDYGPMIERAFAEQSGIGFIGKNGLIITKEFGSWVFLGTIVTDLELIPDKPATRMCGSCTKCIDSCPTGAIVAEGVVDARRCISFQTIENKTNTIPKDIANKSGKWIFGCDICQEVCPHNCRAKLTQTKEFQRNTVENGILDGNDILAMNQEEFDTKFQNSPIKRSKLTGLQRNIRAKSN